MKHHEWIISQNRKLSAMIHVNTFTVRQTPLVICCHGFTSEKVGTNQLMLHLANAIEAAGLLAVRFDFAGSGESDGDFVADTTIKSWREDLRNVVDWVKSRPAFDSLPLYLLGHSLGGLIALSHEDDGIAGRIALAPVTHPVENFQNIILGPDLWQRSFNGHTVANFLSKGFSIGPNFVNDLAENRYDLSAQACSHHSPLLIVHGSQDAVVPPSGSEIFYERYHGEKELTLMEADHVFTGKHEELTALVTGWLAKQKNKVGTLCRTH
ncbi:MAG TPA: alpha/beta fold hydrolase [Methylomusa anaerophila]|uniref:Alpha/beta hydrolase family protein n=1 Tax=Methylomusa anaerophila TaxID=1930071 RepID=A0A348AEL1_9FIRM|nr:alpha/beta fold hydrolase [Methylomusa anaerophila]BBB89509.1 alpha/beta hydrolase family protein [Methylomusa anaerophila]HML90121.1 alpha/beta fold hydrolase [Methylomusa anaerophila]